MVEEIFYSCAGRAFEEEAVRCVEVLARLRCSGCARRRARSAGRVRRRLCTRNEIRGGAHRGAQRFNGARRRAEELLVRVSPQPQANLRTRERVTEPEQRPGDARAARAHLAVGGRLLIGEIA